MVQVGRKNALVMHTQDVSLSLFPDLSLCLSISYPLFLSLFLSVSLSNSLSICLSLSPLFLSFSLSLSVSLFLSVSLSLSPLRSFSLSFSETHRSSRLNGEGGLSLRDFFCVGFLLSMAMVLSISAAVGDQLTSSNS